MPKRIIPVILSLTLLFSISVMAENDNSNTNENTTAISQEISKEENGSGESMTPPQNMQMPQGESCFPGMPGDFSQTETEEETGFLGFLKTYSTPITSLFLLMLAFVFVALYKRKHF